MRGVGWLIVLHWLLVASGSVEAGTPRFELVPLGVFGGEIEGNSSSYLLKELGGTDGILLDAGSPVSGILKGIGSDTTASASTASIASASTASTASIAKVRDALLHTKAIFLTHSHLDHIHGFALMMPLYLEGPLKGTTTDVYGSETTLGAIRKTLFGGSLWGDFSRIPSEARPVVRFRTLPQSTPISVVGLNVESIAVQHPVPSVAYFVAASDGAVYLHVGDTGPTEAVWIKARSLLQEHRLKALSIECSFGSVQAKLALATGHLTPALLVRELSKLAGITPGSETPSTEFGLDKARVLAPRLVKALGSLRIFVTHIKPGSYDEVRRELARLGQAGLSLEVVKQGEPVRF